MKIPVFFFIIFLSISCKKSTESPQPVINESNIKFSKQLLEVNDGQSLIEVEIRGDNVKYEILNPSNWVEIKGLGSNKFNVLIKPNQTSDSRSTKVYLLNDKKIIKDSLTIKQSYLNIYLNVSTEKIKIDKIQPEQNFIASSNAEVKIRSSSDWMKIENVKDSLYRVKFKNNTSNIQRNGVIEISTNGKANNITKKIDIIQSSDYGRYSDSIAIQSLNRAIDFIGLNPINNIRPWSSFTPLNKLKYIETEVINDELRVVGIKNTDSFSNFNINLIDSVKLLSKLKKIQIFKGLLKCENFFNTISHNENLEIIIIPYAKVGGNFDNLYKLKKLKKLELTNTNIGGQFKNNIEELKDLKVLDLSFTNLNGTLPEGFYNLSSLDTLKLYNVNLTGDISPNITKLKNLRVLSLIETMQKGPLPENIGFMENLTNLVIMRTDIEGILPSSIGSLQSLKGISIEHTKMHGVIPKSLVNLKKLESLNLRYNNFSGEIFDHIYQMPSISSIFLDNNNFTGKIDSRIRNLKNITEFRISNNNFTGSIPKELAQYPLIWNFRINNNRFTGVFPQELLNYHRFNSWIAKTNIFPQQYGYGFSNI